MGHSAGIDKEVPDLQKLPAGYSSRNEIPKPSPVCPSDAPVKTIQRRGDRLPVDEVQSEGTDAVEVDFERKIQMANPEAKIYAWRKTPRKWRAVYNRCR